MDNLGSALEQALGNVGQGIGNFFSGVGSQVHNDITPISNYFNPTSNNGQGNFWSQGNPISAGLTGAQGLINSADQTQPFQVNIPSPIANTPVLGGIADFAGGLANIPGQYLQGIARGGTELGNALAQNRPVNAQQFIGDLAESAQLPLALIGGGESAGIFKGAEGILPKLGQGAITGAEYGGGFGALSGLQTGENINNPADYAKNLAQSTAMGVGFGAAMGGTLGVTSPLFSKTAQSLGLQNEGMGLMQSIYNKFGTNSYRFLANKELIQRVITGTGTPEDITQFNILNQLGAAGDVARQPASIEAAGTRIPKSGPVWDFLQQLFPNSFKNGQPVSDFTDPTKTPLQAIPEVSLSPEENQALMNESTVDPKQQQLVEKTEALRNQSEAQTPQAPPVTTQDVAKEGQDLVGPEGQQQLNNQYTKAFQNRPVLDQMLDNVGQKTNAYVVSNFKNPDTTVEKTIEKRTQDPQRDYNLTDVNDVVRGRLIYNSPDEIAGAVQQLKANLPPGVTVAKEDDYFTNPQDAYKGYHVDLAFPNGQHSEVQFHTWKSYASALASHGMHEAFNDETPAGALSQKTQIANMINGMTDQQAKEYALGIEKQNLPKQQETAQKTAAVAQQAYNQAMQNGGATINTAGEEPTQGYAYSPFKAQEKAIDKTKITPQDVSQYMQDHQDQLSQPGNHLGMWEEDGKIWMDISQVGEPTFDTYQKAIDAKQEAVYNLATGETIYTPLSKQYGTKVDSNNPYRGQITGTNGAISTPNITTKVASNIPEPNQNQVFAQDQALSGAKGDQVKTAKVSTKLTSAEKLAQQKSQPIETKGVKFTQDALPQIKQIIDDQNLSREALTPSYVQKVLPQSTWKEFLAAHPDFNNHAGGPEAIQDAHGFFAMLDPRAIVPDKTKMGVTVDKRVLGQFQENQPIIVKQNKAGFYVKVDGQHRTLAAQALQAKQIPVLILDKKSSDLEFAYNNAKNSNMPLPQVSARFPNPVGMPTEVKTASDFAVLRGSEKAKTAAGLPIPPAPLKNPIFGKGDTGDMPPKKSYSPEGAATTLRDNSIPVGNVYEEPHGLGLLKANLIPQINKLINSKDPDAKALGSWIQQRHALYNSLSSTWKTQLEDVLKDFPTSKYEDLWRVGEGKKVSKVVANDPDILKVLSVWKPIASDILTKAQALDMQTFDPESQSLFPIAGRENYMPHAITPEMKAYQDQTTGLDKIIKAGKASNEAEARIYQKNMSGVLKGRRASNLEFSRISNLPFIKDPKVLLSYVDTAARRIADTNYFGGFSQHAQQAIDNMEGKGNSYDANVAKTLMQKIVGGTFMSPEGKAVKDAADVMHNIVTLTDLGPTTFASHFPAFGAAAARVGTKNVVKSMATSFPKALLGKYSNFARSNVPELHQENYNLYGQNAPLINKFYNVIGLSKFLNASRATIADATNAHIQQLETNLTDDKTQRYLTDAGLDSKTIAQRGSLTAQEKQQYVDQSLKSASLVLRAGDLPQLTNSTLGKMAFIFKGPLYQRAARAYPFLIKETKAGNLNPLAAFIVLSTIAGVGTQEVKNLMTNKPASDFQTTLKQGIARGILPPGGEEIANAMQYPEYAGQTAAGIFGGPAISLGSNIVSTAQGLAGTDPNQNLYAQRNIIRTIPVVGPTAANTFLPTKSYPGNRPSDIISAKLKGQDITHGTVPYQYTTKPSLLDLVRQNPVVAKQASIAAQAAGYKNQIMGKLDSSQQATLTSVDDLLQRAANGDPISKIQAYAIMQNQPQIAMAKSQIEVNNAKANGSPLNPLWSLGITNPQAQKIILQYKGLAPADQKAFKSDPFNATVLNTYNDMETKYYNSLPKNSQLGATGLSAPSPSAYVKNLLDQYDKSKAAGSPNYALLDDPQTQQYFSNLDNYDNYINSLEGLPPGSATGTNKSSTGYSSIPGGTYGQIGTDDYMLRALQRQYMLQDLNAAAKITPVTTQLPKPQGISAQHGTQGQQAQAMLKTGLPATSLSLKSLGGQNGQVGPNIQKLSFKVQPPKYNPVRLQHAGQATML